MNETEVGKYWDRNADAWTHFSRAGHNTSRDLLNTPALLGLVGDASGKRALDIGCGDGDLTRHLARRGAKVTGLDISPTFLKHAKALEEREPLGIEYVLGSGQQLPFPDASFDLVTGMMSFMDMPRPDLAITESFRVLKPGGVLAFGIVHPCFQTSKWKWILDENGKRTAVVCGDYFSPPEGRVDVWTFGSASPEEKRKFEKFRIPRFDHTLSWWVNTIVGTGFSLEKMSEPCPDDAMLKSHPDMYDTRIIAYFLHMRCVKPGI